MREWSASTARAARYSFRNPSPTLSVMIPRIMAASVGSPTTNDVAAAATRRTNSGLLTCRSRTSSGRAPWLRMAFSPTTARRRLASAAVSPASALLSRASASAGSMRAASASEMPRHASTPRPSTCVRDDRGDSAPVLTTFDGSVPPSPRSRPGCCLLLRELWTVGGHAGHEDGGSRRAWCRGIDPGPASNGPFGPPGRGLVRSGFGSFGAIMGPSGCGKTTLLNCLSGLDEIDEGEVQIEGVSLKAMSDVERTRYRARRMGFVFQFYNLLGVLTAAENVEMPLLLARVPSGEARERALRALEMVGLPGRDNQLPASLSGGERQRVTIARALVNDPAIVWADEPTGDLDSTRADEIINLMRRLNQEQQITFAIVTHDIGIGRRADRIVRMADGEIVGEEYPA